MTDIIYTLFEGADELGVPANNGAIYQNFDFTTFRAIKTPAYHQALNDLKKGQDVDLYATGFTKHQPVALTQVMFAWGGLLEVYGDKLGKLRVFLYSEAAEEWIALDDMCHLLPTQ